MRSILEELFYGNICPNTDCRSHDNGRPYFVTTIEALNSSGVLVAVQDSPIHVSVRPRGATMRDWIDAGKYSIWTHTVYYLSIKCRG